VEKRTEWHRVVLFGRLAEIAGEYLHEGSGGYIEGRMQTRKWQDQEGQDRYSTEIVAHSMELLDRKVAESPHVAMPGQAHAECLPEGGLGRRARSKMTWLFLCEKPPQARDIEDGVPVAVRAACPTCVQGELVQWTMRRGLNVVRTFVSMDIVSDGKPRIPEQEICCVSCQPVERTCFAVS